MRNKVEGIRGFNKYKILKRLLYMFWIKIFNYFVFVLCLKIDNGILGIVGKFLVICYFWLLIIKLKRNWVVNFSFDCNLLYIDDDSV